MPTSGSSNETSPREFGPLILDYHPEASLELIETVDFIFTAFFFTDMDKVRALKTTKAK